MSGKLADPENVLVDVGARYYIEKVRAELGLFHKRGLIQIQAYAACCQYVNADLINQFQSTKDARTFYNQKMLDIRKSLDQLQPTIEQKNENRQVVMEYLQIKLSSRDRENPSQ